jgi:hypothetical protein
VLTTLLTWHGLRRLFDLPRVPRPAAVYLALGGAWLASIAAAGAAVGGIALLRDYRDVDHPTALAEVRCAALDGQRVRLELQADPAATPERYDVEGDACVVWVEQVELRPGFQRLGIHALSRVNGVGAVARPASNPDWLTPRPQGPRRLVDLVVRRATTVPVAVPLDAHTRLVLVSSPTGPTIEQRQI